MKKIIALILALIFILAFSACSNEAANTEPTEEDLALYEEILFNFGGTYRHDGSLIVSRKGSLYDLREGIEDCSAMAFENYYTWAVSRTENSDKIKVMLPGAEAQVYAFSADFYEGEIGKFFGVDAEQLKECDFYFADQNCYYYEGVSAGSDYVNIDFVSAEENGENLTVHFTLTDLVNGTTNHSLTVKLIEDGGYQYLSYIAE